MKTKLLTFVAALLMATTTFAQFSGSGSGTSSDPYLIFNPIQLDQVRNFLNQGGVYFKLMADIDLAEFIADNYPTQGWQPIGTQTSPFGGVFNGNGKTIKNLTINRPSASYVGLFGYIKSMNASNRTSISSLTIEGTIIGGDYTGGLVGTVENSNLKNVCVRGHIEGNKYVGGISGSYYSGEIRQVQNCFVEASIEGIENVGGVIGNIDYGVSLATSTAIVNIKCTGNNVGGIVGNAYRFSFIRTCCAFGRIEANNYAGGIVGYSEGYSDGVGSLNDIEDNYFHGTLKGKGAVGGVCCFGKGTHILRNYSCATILGISAYGIASGGNNYTNIKQNVAINSKVYGTTSASRVGSGNGEIGTNETNKALTTTKVIINGVEQVCEDNMSNGQGVGNSTLKYQATYQGIQWDFSNKWAIQETETYPYFKRQVAPPTINDAASGQTTVSGKGTNGKVIKVYIDGKTYQTTCSNNTWSVTTDALVGGSIIYAYAGTGTATSYPATTTVAYKGSGTDADPYKIYTAQELANIHGDGYFKLMNDIDVSSINPWIPIGQNEIVTAHLNGDNHTISGLKINTTDNYQGLFAQCNGNTFKNITISVSQLKGGDYTGALVGKIIGGHIEKCTINGNVTGGENTGGLAGYTQNTWVGKCIANSNVVGTTKVGGLIGTTQYNTIKLSKSTGSVSSTTANAVIGGLIGVSACAVETCCASGAVICTKSSSIVGGFIGQNNGKNIQNCYSEGAVTGTKYAGGLVGLNKGSVENCYARGKITGTNAAGGLVGYNDGAGAFIKKCCVMNPTITASSSTGIVMRVVGGLLNSAPAPDMNNYALKTMALSVNGVAQTIYDDNLNGTAKTDNVLKQVSTYSGLGWNMTSVWGIIEGSGYPYLMCFEGSQSFTATFVDWDGTELKKESVQYGKTPTPPSNPTRTGYTFTGWSPNITQITKNTTYTATYKVKQYTITFKNEDGSVIESKKWDYGTTPSCTTPTKAASAQYTYTFAGWSPNVVAVTGDATYTATYTNNLRQYTITFKNDDGSVIESKQWNYGVTPNCAEPTKQTDSQYTYAFAGWNKQIEAVSGDATYTATYTSTLRKYTITFLDEDGTTLSSQQWNYGATPTCDEPTKASTAQYTYTFAGWTPEVTSVKGAATYTATYTSTLRKYTITFLDEDGTTLSSQQWNYGTTPTCDEPSKTATAQYTYTFAGWDTEIVSVKGAATYTATYTSTLRKYTITFLDEDGTTLSSQQWNYGTTPTCDEPTKPATAQYTYTFVGWDQEVTSVKGNATYTATYSSVTNQYSVVFIVGPVNYPVVVDYGTQMNTLIANLWSEAETQYGFTQNIQGDYQYSDGTNVYTFTGWDKDIPETVTGADTYTATYTTAPVQPTALDEIVQTTPAIKVLRNGQLFILRDGKVCTVTGQEVE